MNVPKGNLDKRSGTGTVRSDSSATSRRQRTSSAPLGIAPQAQTAVCSRMRTRAVARRYGARDRGAAVLAATGTVIIPALADFPAHRRFDLLWRYALTHRPDEVDTLVQRAATRGCPVPSARQESVTAELGDDGRFHLATADHWRCRSTIASAPGVWRHEHSCHWWTDGVRYRLQPPQLPHPDHGRLHTITVTYTVRATGTYADPADVLRTQRCQLSWGWPGLRTTSSVHGRLRRELAQAFGAMCAACRCRPGSELDHDHFTGLLRGLVCAYCNSRLDRCLHPDGCAYAEYLNAPPAVRIALVYPQKRRLRSTDQARIDRTGIDPFTDSALCGPGATAAALEHALAGHTFSSPDEI